MYVPMKKHLIFYYYSIISIILFFYYIFIQYRAIFKILILGSEY